MFFFFSPHFFRTTLFRQEEIIKLLLLGAGESGKSTIFRQMKLLFGKAFSEEELRNLIPVVHSNILANFILVLQNAAPKGVDIAQKEIADQIMSEFDEETPITEAIGQKLKLLWQDKGVQNVWSQRSSFQVLDSLEYYMGENGAGIDRIASPKYIPTEGEPWHLHTHTHTL